MRTAILITTAVAALLTAGQTVAAGHIWQVGTASFNVHLDDLDLQSKAGRAEALRRVEQAAVRACRDGAVLRRQMACQAATIEAAAQALKPDALRRALAERTQETSLAWAR